MTVEESSPYFSPDYITRTRRGADYAALLRQRRDIDLYEIVPFQELGVVLLRFERSAN